MARLHSLGRIILIGAQISDMVRHIKSEMTMHIQNWSYFYIRVQVSGQAQNSHRDV